MTRFQITAHSDGGCRSLTMMGDGRTTVLDSQRNFAASEGTELIMMYEFEVPDDHMVDHDPGMGSELTWGEAKRIADAFWAGHDAPRLPGDWRGCPWHSGELHGVTP